MKGKKNDIFILLIFITVVCGLGGFLLRERFVSKDVVGQKPYLWVWCPTEYNSKKWSSFHGRSNTTYTPDYIKMCIETVRHHCSDSFTVVLLNEDNIVNYIPKAVHAEMKGTDKCYKYDMTVTTILDKYGGVWLPASTIVFKDLIPLYSHIVENDMYFGGFSCDSDEYFCLNSDNPDRSVFMAPPRSPVIHEWRNQLFRFQKGSQNDYSFNKRGSKSLKAVLRKFPSKVHLFDASMNGTRDCSLKLVGADSLLSSNIGSLANPKHLYLLNFDRTDISENHKYNWFERASYDSIIQSTLWFTLLYRAAVGLDINIDENVVGKSNTRNS